MRFTDVLREIPSNKVLIAVIGIYQGGKSAFLASISDHVWSEVEASMEVHYSTVEEPSIRFTRIEPTTISVGEIKISDNTSLILLETYSCCIWEGVIEYAGLNDIFSGIVLLFNSARPETFREVKSMLTICLSLQSHPYVIAANHQDHPDAWNLDDLRMALRLQTEMIMPCIAIQPESANSVFLKLLDSLPDHPVIAQAAKKVRHKPSV